ncbi:MAG: hypothetical protein JO316_24020 [Abitibacteriaceae bacterium]|nr:hypothetical protein [Abditibacteriaceae bacterium]
MVKHGNRWVALGTLGVMVATSFGGLATTAQASTKGKRNLAIGLGAVTAYGLLKHKRSLAIAGGLGTAYAYSRYRKSKKNDDRRRSASYWSRTHRYSRYRTR